MTDKIILVVSFGTSYNNNRALTIGAIEKDIDEAFPDYEMRRAFTSQMVINILKKRDDLAIDNVEEALERALNDGVKTVIIQPTHIMNGTEYHFKIKDTVDKYIDKFENIPITRQTIINAMLLSILNDEIDMSIKLKQFLSKDQILPNELGDLLDYVLEHNVSVTEYFKGEEPKLIYNEEKNKLEIGYINDNENIKKLIK
jgi:cobalamin biosynthesis Co2+ chelatase CbiK